MRRNAWLLAVGLAIAIQGPASGENLEQYGLGPRAQGMGGAFTALASDSTAAYYNPGGLVFSRHLNLTLGFSYADYQLGFDSERGGDLDRKAEQIVPLSALTLGVSTTFPLDRPDRIGLGLSIFLPTRGVVNLEAKAQSTEPEWFSYGKRHDRVRFIPAIGVKVTDWFSLGLGLPLSLVAAGSTDIDGGLTAPIETEFDLRLRVAVGAHVGFLFTPADWLSFGITYRSEVDMRVKFEARPTLEGISLPLKLKSLQYFSPHQLQFGVAVNVTDDLLFTFDGLWVNWSAYDTPFIDVSSNTVAVIDADEVDLKDVYSAKLGVEVVCTDWLVVRGGYSYRTSAVPDQSDEATNLVDSPKHVFSFGLGFAFGQEPEAVSDEAKTSEGRAQTMDELLLDASFDLDLFVQYHLHESVSASKPPSDPVGDWDADGGILNFGFALTARF